MSHVSLLDGHDDDDIISTTEPIIINKLVRDKIPEIIEASGQKCECKILSEEDVIFALETKLDEELAEYREDHSIEELADILEVILALTKARGYSMDELADTFKKKRAERGGFYDRIYLTKIYP